ncbi:hypothetical protein KUTeg_007057 [Tegillarca granosa]|uniref:Uncharacterized protein n=1 Tax=Tegillarca granosa TaxID=220873 RepID=A0ABQ9FGB1_TEGGR|nr:hypothetical protein KUTeg_007057 [Tegillarca granosa]
MKSFCPYCININQKHIDFQLTAGQFCLHLSHTYDLYSFEIQIMLLFIKLIFDKHYILIKAMKEGFKVDPRSLSPTQAKRYGDLLSHLFERNWGIHTLTDDYKVLQRAVTWKPFLHFVEMFCKF